MSALGDPAIVERDVAERRAEVGDRMLVALDLTPPGYEHGEWLRAAVLVTVERIRRAPCGCDEVFADRPHSAGGRCDRVGLWPVGSCRHTGAVDYAQARALAADPFERLVAQLTSAASLEALDLVHDDRDGWAPEHDALLELRRCQLAARFDVDTVADAAREELATIEEHQAADRERFDPSSEKYNGDRARGWRRLLGWLANLLALPLDRIDWPCPVCCAEAGQPCDLPECEDSWTEPGPRFHFDRGWSRNWGSTRPEHLDGCWPTLSDGPARTHRGECVGCSWLGPVRAGRDAGSVAVHDAHDHAWPGWRDLPVVPRPPKGETNPKQRAKVEAAWRREVAAMMPEGWLEAGGPIRTERVRPGTRDVPNGAPGGGYDIAVVLEAPRGATLHDLDDPDPDPANEAVQGRTRRSCAASGHLRRKNADGGEVEYHGRVYCRCGRASYEPNAALAAS